MTLRLRFWLHALDVANWLDEVSGRRLRWLYLWTLARAADATDWGDHGQ